MFPGIPGWHREYDQHDYSMITHYLKHNVMSGVTLLTYMDASIHCWASFPMDMHAVNTAYASWEP